MRTIKTLCQGRNAKAIMINKQNIYETKITDLRWIIYDIPANVGWISYFVGLIFALSENQTLYSIGKYE